MPEVIGEMRCVPLFSPEVDQWLGDIRETRRNSVN